MEDLVEDWLARGEDGLERWEYFRDEAEEDDQSALEAAAAAYDILVSWAGLGRLRALGPDLDPEPVRRRIEEVLKENKGEIMKDGLLMLSPQDWLAQGDDLLEWSLDPSRPQDTAAGWALDLLREVDDFDLLLYAVDALMGEGGLDDEDRSELEAGVARCLSWAASHPEAFLEAGHYARLCVEAFRRDLDEADPALALTQVKFFQLLDEVERAWRATEYKPVRVFGPGEAAAMLRDLRGGSLWERARRRIEGLSREVQEVLGRGLALPEYAPVLSCGAAETADEESRIRWSSLEGEGWSAWMNLPAPREARDEREVYLWLKGVPLGSVVVLAGLERAMKEGRSCVTFTLGELRRAWEENAPVLVWADEGGIHLGGLERSDGEQ